MSSNRNRAAIVAMGANLAGVWGTPRQTLIRALAEFERCGVTVLAVGGLYRSRAIGVRAQPEYLNTVCLVQPNVSGAFLLRLCKLIERRSGRRSGPSWSARPLDLDIIAFGPATHRRRPPIRSGGPGARGAGVILPHPEVARRGFVLLPLQDIQPHWVHPLLGRTVQQLIADLPARWRGRGVGQLITRVDKPQETWQNEP